MRRSAVEYAIRSPTKFTPAASETEDRKETVSIKSFKQYHQNIHISSSKQRL